MTNDIRAGIFFRDLCICQFCGRSIYRERGQPQIAHCIARTKNNIAKYGLAVIDHPLNLKSVCCLKCNDACNIGFKTAQAEELANKIREALFAE